jgi:hypothetical protein
MRAIKREERERESTFVARRSVAFLLFVLSPKELFNKANLLRRRKKQKGAK